MSLVASDRVRMGVSGERATQRRKIDVAASAITAAAVLSLSGFWVGVLLLLAR